MTLDQIAALRIAVYSAIGATFVSYKDTQDVNIGVALNILIEQARILNIEFDIEQAKQE